MDTFNAQNMQCLRNLGLPCSVAVAVGVAVAVAEASTAVDDIKSPLHDREKQKQQPNAKNEEQMQEHVKCVRLKCDRLNSLINKNVRFT